jgi:hypothetical protein
MSAVPAWLAWVEHILSLGGAALLAGWLLRWVGHYTSKHRELADMDKEIRSALTEAIGMQKEIRQAENEKFLAKMSVLEEQVATLQAGAGHRDQTIAGLRQQLDRVWIASALSTRIASVRTKELSANAFNMFHAQAHQIARRLGISAADLRDAPNAPQGSDLEDQENNASFLRGILYQQGEMIGSYETMAKIAAAVVPSFLAEQKKNPAATTRELLEKIADQISRGDLDNYG